MLAIVVLFVGALGARAQEEGAVTDRIVRDIMQVCDAPSVSLAESAAALQGLGYERQPDAFYHTVISGMSSRAARPIAPETRQSWRAVHGESQVVGELRSGRGNHALMAEFMLIRVDSARVVELVRGHYGASRTAESDGQVSEFFAVAVAGQSDVTRPVVLIFDPNHVNVPRIACGPPPTPEPAALEPSLVAREFAEEVWRICSLQAPAFSWFGDVIGVLPGRYRRVPESRMAMLDDEELSRAQAEAGIRIVAREAFVRRLGADAVIVEVHQQVQNGATNFVATFKFGQSLRQPVLQAVAQRFGPGESAALDSEYRGPDIGVFGARAPDGAGSVIYVGGENTDQLVCSLAPTG